MTKSILFVVLIAAAGAAPREYAGPRCLGPFCLNVRVSDRSLFDRLGATTEASTGNLHCYESSNGGASLYFETIDTEPHTVGDVFVSVFPNCMHMGVHKTSTNLQEWKTAEGIGLGSTEADVIKAYGDPSVQIPINEASSNASGKADTPESIARLRIRGFRKGDKNSKVADRRLFYGPDANSDDLRAAEFGIRDGKVSWIFLSRNE